MTVSDVVVGSSLLVFTASSYVCFVSQVVFLLSVHVGLPGIFVMPTRFEEEGCSVFLLPKKEALKPSKYR